MRVRLILEVDIPCPPPKSKKEARKEFDKIIMENLAGGMQHHIPGEVVYVATEVLDSGITLKNLRRHP